MLPQKDSPPLEKFGVPKEPITEPRNHGSVLKSDVA